MNLYALFFFLLALALFVLAARLRRATGLPSGRVVSSDTGAWGRVEKPLYSADLRLTGKPDYVVSERGRYIPVEVKSRRAPAGGPYSAHIYQLAAYCVLITEAYGTRPTHGLIQYADKIFAVDYTPALEKELLQLLTDIRADAEAEDVARSHHMRAKCAACGLNTVCDEALA